MPIAEIPKQVTSSAQDAVQGLTVWAGNLYLGDRRWLRILGAASLFTGAMLLIGGKRKKGALAAATVGTVLVMLEEPKNLASAWVAVPSYLQAGERLLDRLEGFAEQIAAQGHRVRGFVDRVQR
jgi:hypothetical protein